MCCRLIGKSEQASASHISGAKSCETKGKPLVQIPLVSAHSVRRAKSLYVNISGAKQFLCTAVCAAYCTKRVLCLGSGVLSLVVGPVQRVRTPGVKTTWVPPIRPGH